MVFPGLFTNGCTVGNRHACQQASLGRQDSERGQSRKVKSAVSTTEPEFMTGDLEGKEKRGRQEGWEGPVLVRAGVTLTQMGKLGDVVGAEEVICSRSC